MPWELLAVLAVVLLLFAVFLVVQQRGQERALRQSEERMQRELSALRQEIAGQEAERGDRLLGQVLALGNGLEGRLDTLRSSNERNLEQIRQTVDEKLQQTLEQKISASFSTVSESLEQVHKGLGEMQSLAAGVGDLKRVLLNVKNRGVWGEVQLGRLLEDMLSPGQYETNVAVNPQTAYRVEYAIRLPGAGDDGRPLYLPIDAKFPLEDYQLLLDAEERGDALAAAEAQKALASRLKGFAKDVSEKYVCPPYTTDFAILFLPLEGLYSELLRRPAFVEQLQREYRIVPAGPSTLSAILNSLQMGFRTLAIEARTGEVWQLLDALRAGFADFTNLLEKTQKKLQEASHSVEDAARKSRAIQRRLRAVGNLEQAQELNEEEEA